MSDDESPGLGLDLPAADQPAAAPGYLVLARKYRPQRFSELIGQEAMVRTLANAIARDRIAHAFLLTGVRGVGKTSTARLIAKALNCVGPDGSGGPTIDPCGACEPCLAIAQGRHIDVIEMDAASHNGIDDIREIVDAVRYAAVSARFKTYIIDEVHMLSKPAFNALLKTLEEPPSHVKFLFATTEVAKVPVTVLSRCQRFDLRRIPAERLTEHFARIAVAEGVEAEAEALALIARVAEGSVRDGLSILDQAIAHGHGRVEAAAVRAMLGLADGGRVRDVLAAILGGDAGLALARLDEAHALGLDPAALVRGLLQTVHAISRAKTGAPPDPAQPAEEREALAHRATSLSWGVIHRLWQMLLKGLAEVETAPDPAEAAAMAVLRLVHAADLPDPASLVARLARGGGGAPTAPGAAGPASAAPAEAAGPAPAPVHSQPDDFGQLVEMLEAGGRHRLAVQLRDHVGLVGFAPGELAIRPLGPLDSGFAAELAAALRSATASAWRVSLAEEGGEPSLLEQERIAEEQLRSEILGDPMVREALDLFPQSTLESITPAKDE